MMVNKAATKRCSLNKIQPVDELTFRHIQDMWLSMWLFDVILL